MSLATYLQNELMTLSNEARRKNPEIKDVMCDSVIMAHCTIDGDM